MKGTRMATTTKRDLIERVAENTTYSRAEVRDLVQKVFDLMAADLAAGKRIEFRDFGVFEVRQRNPRTAKNPRTNVRVEVPARLTIRFKPGQELKAKVNQSPVNTAPKVIVTAAAKEPAAV